MSVKVRIPNAGSQTTVSGSIPSSLGNDVWLGFTTPITSSGSVTFFRSSSEVAGSILCSVVASPGITMFFPYPVNSASNGLFAGCISGGSVFWWITL